MLQKDTLIKNYESQWHLISAIKNNNEAVLKTIYNENYHHIERYVLSNSGNSDQAKDVYQEAFITLWENINLDKFSPTSDNALNYYLYNIAKNKWLDYLKSSKFKKTDVLTDFKINTITHEENVDLDPLKNKKIDKIVASFDLLKDPCKKILSVFYYENKSIKDIAETFNITEASAKNKKYRCLERLRAMALTSI
ncbi:RNA polymerase sigma-70 factor (ECF subfamily) [Mariniflexile fucanivorans]|uniref:RNA polymerase sigma-70 factor (ECF subfamily) n=1 Tax=Mariniflexile fucanivorans TaxID=264023 RepID=A0A4R1RRL7_9FLAO|nr:sigma-70 family RNA polymerase sigma factor [Mariniflexile fucanivorans]TCL69075.1 RNA polymerase sigma-70 factor (ECF subfamily) [Mariniflexile fucanivorans]